MVRTFRLSLLSLIFLAVASPAGAEMMVPLMVRAGSSLTRLANLYCHEREDWRRVAEINKLRPPYIIYKDTTLLVPAELLLGENVSAVVGTVYGTAQLSSTILPSRSVAVGDKVPPGAIIETGEDSHVLLIFPDQRFIQVSAVSRLRVDFALRLADGSVQVKTTLEQGETSNDVKPGSNHNDRYNSGSPTALIGVRGTEYRLKVNGAESTQVETLRGEVSATAQGVSRIVPLAQGIIIHKKRPPGLLHPLPLPPDGLAVEKVYNSQPVHFQLPENSSGGTMHLTISRDAQGSQVVTERVGKAKESLAVNLPEDGLYFATMSTVDKAGFEGLPAPPKAFALRTSPGAPILIIPKNAHFFTPSAALCWTGLKEAASYRVMVAQDADFTKPLSEATVPATSWNTQELLPGLYYVRVQSIAADGFQSVWSKPASFTIAKPPQLLDSELVADGPIMLHWSAAPGSDTYDLQMAAEPDFIDPLVEAKGLQRPEYTFENQLNPGVYYLRMRSNSPDGSQSLWGPTQKITIHPAPMTLPHKLILGALMLCIIL